MSKNFQLNLGQAKIFGDRNFTVDAKAIEYLENKCVIVSKLGTYTPINQLVFFTIIATPNL